MRLSKYIPSMYQRRLLLIVGGLIVLAAFPALQMARLTLVSGDILRAAAEKHLISEQWLPSVRGEIRDRKGRVLAMDRPSLDIAIDYPVITGEWADAMAARSARAAAQGRWAQLSPRQRDDLVAQHLPPFEAHLDRMWALIARTADLPREHIDQRAADIRREVEVLATIVTERQRQQRERELNRTGDDPADAAASTASPADAGDLATVATADVRRPIREESARHVLLKNVPDTVGFEFERLLRQTVTVQGSTRPVPVLPGLAVIDNTRRDYPLETVDVPIDRSVLPGPLRQDGVHTVRVEGVATHLIGWMRSRIFKEDADRRPLKRADGSVDFGHYRAGDQIGQGGFEQAAEDDLRGLRGVRRTHLDTGKVETTAPVAGRPVDLTIDALLQARIQALFDPGLGLTVVQPWHKVRQADTLQHPSELPTGQALNGAVVVLDIATGDVLALVSAPSFTRTGLADTPEEIFTDRFALAYLNRAIDKPYPPGSIVKPIVYADAVTRGVFSVDGRVACHGHFYPEQPTKFRCWIFKQFNDTHSNQLGHDVDASDAVKVSCNIFFFELGRRLGPGGMHGFYTSLGVGADAPRWNLFALPPGAEGSGLLHEQRGSVPRTDKATSAEAVLMGIGQGPVTWTPLHAAGAMATLARGGVALSPRIRAGAPQTRADLNYTPAAVAKALDGLRRSAEEERGTTHSVTYDLPDDSRRREQIFDVPGVDVWAKSGTADAPPFIADLARDGQDDTFDGDHAWCVLLAGVNGRPMYSVAVVVDYGGSGGRVAGPLANQVLRTLAAEGYLPGVGSGERSALAPVGAEAHP